MIANWMDLNFVAVGIWVWSDMYTHEYENGDKVAIILIDTQGIFDSKSSVHDCMTIFALSTLLLSSVQCYNLMQNIREDDLQHLELFTQYGRLVLEQSNEIPFRKLIFILRDWPYVFETNPCTSYSLLDAFIFAHLVLAGYFLAYNCSCNHFMLLLYFANRIFSSIFSMRLVEGATGFKWIQSKRMQHTKHLCTWERKKHMRTSGQRK